MAMATLQARATTATSFVASRSPALSNRASRSPALSNRASRRPVSVPFSTEAAAWSESSVRGAALRVRTRAPERRSASRSAGRGPVRALANDAGDEEVAPRGARVIHGRCFVVGDNIDTDQIIPAEYLTLVPSKPEEYEKLGSYAMIGLPEEWGKFIQEGKTKTEYKVIIGGDNFGCGSSREHAPVALGAAGARAVVAESYARIFFRNSVATGELYPVETQARIWQENHTGDIVTLDMEKDVLVNHTTGKTYSLKPIGEAGPVIDAGGIFAYARSTGMIAAAAE